MLAARTKILVVEADPRYRAFVQHVVHGLGHETCAAADATSAIRVARLERPDAVVLEYRLSCGSARWLIERLDDVLASGCPPVVVLSRDARAGRCARWPEVAAVVRKPIDPAALAEAVDAALDPSPRPRPYALAAA